jgi:hypothetical protein
MKNVLKTFDMLTLLSVVFTACNMFGSEPLIDAIYRTKGFGFTSS